MHGFVCLHVYAKVVLDHLVFHKFTSIVLLDQYGLSFYIEKGDLNSPDDLERCIIDIEGCLYI